MRVRLIRGMTQRELADRLAELGDDPVSVKAISAWEHGQRTVSVQHITYLAEALDILEQDLFDASEPIQENKVRAILAAANYSEHERTILRYAALDWDGDVPAIIEWIGAYVSMKPADRAEAAGYLIYLFSKAATNEGVPFTVNLELLRKKLRILEEER